MSNEVATIDNNAPPPAIAPDNRGVFSSMSAFEDAQRMATALSSSPLVPDAYRGPNGVGSALIALDMASRVNASPMMVMQNLNVIHGRPSWASQFVIAALNSCGRFSPLRFAISGKGDTLACFAWAEDKTGEKLEGPEVTMAMAKAEGWIDKKGSKWKTMPELMIRYRSAAFFGRLYAPDVLMGMPSADETLDIGPEDYTVIESKPIPDIAEASPAEKSESEAPKKTRSRVTKAQLASAAGEGYQAFHNGLDSDDFPASFSTGALRKAHAEGWAQAEKETQIEESHDTDKPETGASDAPFDIDDETTDPAAEEKSPPPLVDAADNDFAFGGE